ncbi:MAG TPA: ABC transporter permease [Solirubrobacteraceae bacterium]|jgi:peptide/nickel transport system permease protein
MSATAAEFELSPPHATRRFSRTWTYPSLTVGLTLFGLILLAVILGPVLTGYGPNTQDLTAILQGPSPHHLLGTDELGRDELTRLLYAGRTDLKVGILAVLFPFCFGTAIGTLAGYYGGWLDATVMRVVDVLVAFPFYVLVIGLVFVVGTGIRGIFIAFAIADWVVYARTVRASTLVVREADYVAAARVGGLSDLRILGGHVLPNTISQAIVYIMTDVVLVIVAVVTLGYLGLGAQPPTPDWGAMINDGQDFITTHWMLATLPGIAVVLTGLSLSLIGDGLADALRPK